ncbi:MAG: uncharacterized protein KVP18_000583 [Porospora cf. gigantea A]|uniref:uncharacterized protein n=1 Tax=Porospora cf. gigantea A TaxID=2853593 RepID=UPI0035599856|nr:MAG: hypothetical protein KVP18_000583 [Porospora cf. gigantea A]
MQCLSKVSVAGRSVALPGPLRKRKGQLFHCHAHEDRTCCTRESVTPLIQYVQELRPRRQETATPSFFTDVDLDNDEEREVSSVEDVLADSLLDKSNQVPWNLSRQCHTATVQAYCAVCDGDVGTGLKTQKSTPVLCSNYCDQWYEMCKEDLFANSSGRLVPVTGLVDGATTAAKLSELVASPTSFCALSGFVVRSTLCFDGTTASALKGAAPADDPAADLARAVRVLVYLQSVCREWYVSAATAVGRVNPMYVLTGGLVIWWLATKLPRPSEDDK